MGSRMIRRRTFNSKFQFHLLLYLGADEDTCWIGSSAYEILNAVESAMSTYGTDVITVVGHSLGTLSN